MNLFVKLNVNVVLDFEKFLYLWLSISLISYIKPINLKKGCAIYKYFFYHAVPIHFALVVN